MTSQKKLDKLNRKIAKQLGIVYDAIKFDGHWEWVVGIDTQEPPEWATNIQAAMELLERMDDTNVYIAFMPTSEQQWHASYSHITTSRHGCGRTGDTAAEAICRLFIAYCKERQSASDDEPGT